MITKLFTRFLLLLPVLAGVTLVTFILISSVPGDPVYAMVGERADEKLIESYREKLGLNHGFFKRYISYISLILKGDLGQSYYTGRPVGTELIEKFPNTLLLAGTAVIFSLIFGIILGIMGALLRDTWIDKVLMVICTAFISLPVFWYGMLLVYFFAYSLKFLPSGGMDHPLAILLPALTLGSRSMAYLARLTRSCLLEILNSPYILAVKARGGGKGMVIRHAMINVMMPVITFIGLDFGSYLNGSVLTETIFGWDGIGRYAIQGILRRDYPVILGTVLLGASIFVLVNLLIDLSYMFINPRLRKS